ncbi:MAG: CHASE2 domain-containing protein [Chitinivibrionales bacterium]
MNFLIRISKGLLISAVSCLILILITEHFMTDLFERFENQSYYMRYRLKYADFSGDTEERKKRGESLVKIVDIDDRSMHKLGNYWNWNRSYHARMLNSLYSHDPAALGFDIMFFDPEDQTIRKRFAKVLKRSEAFEPGERDSILRYIDYDKQLIQATRSHHNVYHSLRMSSLDDYPEINKSQIMHRTTKEWHDSLNPESALQYNPARGSVSNTGKSVIDGIFPGIAEAAKGIGHINMPPSKDGIVRETKLFYTAGKEGPVYMPLSLRMAADLFGTPNSEIEAVPEKYIDLGSRFKILKDSSGRISFSYPGITMKQVSLFREHSDEILSLKPGEFLKVSSLVKAGRNEDGKDYISTNSGDFPEEIVSGIAARGIDSLLSIKPGDELSLSRDVSLIRDTETDWLITAPFEFGEWYLMTQDLKRIADFDTTEFRGIAPGEERIITYNCEVRNKQGTLVSTIPVIRDMVLKELCSLKKRDIEELEPGTRLDLGGNIRVPLTRDNTHILTFSGNRGTPFQYLSYYDVMKDRIQGGLSGRIFLVGSTVPALFDIVSTPVSSKFPAVEVHASLLQSCLTGEFVQKLSYINNILILVLLSVLVGTAAYITRPLYSSSFTLATVFIYSLVALHLFSEESIWIEMARPLLAAIFTYTVIMAWRYITEEKDRKFLQNTFKTYLSPELIDRMYKERQSPKLGGDEGIRTAFFTDIQSFSTFSEKLGSPSKLVELLNEYLTEMTDSLLKNYGTLDKYEGDAIIAFFGAPMPLEDHARAACTTALEMQNKLRDLRRKWKSEGEKWPEIVHEMRMRIGINTGVITTGNMGSNMRMNYTMMGDAVNLAARLEAAAKQYGVYTMISEATLRELGDEFTVRQVDKITVVGKTEPVTVYELIGESKSISDEYQEFLNNYNRGLEHFYSQEWDKAIEILTEAETMERFREIAPGGMSPSRKILGYARGFRANPPGKDWDGVMRLTSK